MRRLKVIFFACLWVLFGSVFLLQGSLVSAVDFGFGIKQDGNIKARQDLKIWGVEENQKEDLLEVVKSFVNRTLWILALLALVLVLYGGFLMVIAAGNEEKYKKWWNFLKYAVIWLIFIGLAWFVLSLIFWLLNTTAGDAWGADSLS